MEFLNKQIERDIEAQKDSLGSRKTLLEANLRQFGNMKDAYDMTRIQLQAIQASQIQAAGAQAQGDIARSIAAQHGGALKQKVAQDLQQFEWRRTLAMTNPIEAMPEEQRKRVVTMPDGDMHLARTPDDATKMKDALSVYKGMEATLGRAETHMTDKGTSWLPFTDERGEASALKGTLMGEARKLLELGVLQEHDMAFVEKMVPDPGQVLTSQGLAKLQIVRNYVRDRLKAELGSRLPGAQMPTQVKQNANVTGGYSAGRS